MYSVFGVRCKYMYSVFGVRCKYMYSVFGVRCKYMYSVLGVRRCPPAFTASNSALTNPHLFPEGVCLAKHESSYDTEAVGGPNGNGSYDHGLFQLNDKFWCDWSSSHPSRRYRNACSTNCNCEYVFMYVRMLLYVCMYACLFACVYECMYLCMYVFMYV